MDLSKFLPAISFILISPSLAIFNGEDANIRDFPWHVSLQNQTGHQCGGSILSRNVVLTAEHCLVSAVSLTEPAYTAPILRFDFPKYRIKAGMTDLREEGVGIHELKNSPVLYGKFDASDGHDLSLVVLDKCLEFNDKVQPIEIATPEASDRLVKAGNTVTAIGWGMSALPDVFPDHLQRGELAVRTYEEGDQAIAGSSQAEHFQKLRGSPFFPRGTLILAGGKGVDTGVKDSGGSVTAYDPLSGKHVLVGITSWGAYDLGAYVRAANFKGWIDRQVARYAKRCK